MSLDLRPFTEDDLEAAATLLATRHRRDRAAQPLLAKRFEDVDACAAELADTLARDGASGVVGLRADRRVGFVLGYPKPDDTWGPNMWVEGAGSAVERAEDARELYAAAAASWVDAGRTVHYVVLPATDHELVSAWFRLSFGHQHTHACMPLPATPLTVSPIVRRARREDVAVLARLEIELPAHQGRAPVFSAGRVPDYQEAYDEWQEDFDDPAYATFVAEVDGVVLGSAIGLSLERSNGNGGLLRAEDAGFLGFAAVLPDARGRGLGRALGEAVIEWSREQGYTRVVTDWRETNLLSSRAWPALGFVPTYLRLHRVVGY